MTEINTTTQQAERNARKSYAAPKLETFGEVSALTAAGSVAGMEVGNMITTEMG